ncbi:MAG: putative porin [Microscillaceae bacterium]|nr:putative porin [Microscillaceae bacterium]
MLKITLIGFLGLIGGVLPQYTFAQILDDSTKKVYGSTTTKYFLESDVLDDTGKLRIIDTTLNAFHQFNHVNRRQNFYQDLGGWGTAMRPLFYTPPVQIGTRVGIDVYQPFAFAPENVKYYDTKSPYIEANYVQGTTGDQMIDFTYTRNVNARWNLGGRYIRLNTNKQYGAESGRDPWTDHISTVIFTAYQSKNKRYRLLYHFAHLNQQVKETGGVQLDPTLENDNLFGYRNADARLGNSVQSWQTQNHHHLYQHFVLDKGFTVFQTLDVQRQRDTYIDVAVDNHRNFYPAAQVVRRVLPKADTVYYINNTTTNEGTIFQLYENKGGIKGKLGKFNYQAYFKSRLYYWNNELGTQRLRIFTPDSVLTSNNPIVSRMLNGFENFIGGKLFYQLNDSTRLTVEAEHLLARDYRINAHLESKFFQAAFKSVLYSPTALQRSFISNHLLWNKSYSNTLANEISGGIYLRTKKLLFNPFGSYTTLTNYIYFDTQAMPQQSNQTIQLVQVGFNFNYQLGRFKTVNTAIYSGRLGADLIRFPALFANTRVYCEDCFFTKVLQSQIGVEGHFKSDYFADDYLPVSKQFHLQNDFLIQSYLIVDVFANFKVSNFRIFGKFSHINQVLNSGYLTSPLYPGMRRTFTFGVTWLFFD